MKWLGNPGVRIGLGAASVVAAATLANLLDLGPASEGLAIAACVAAYVTYVRLVEKRPATELAITRRAPVELAFGFAVGAALFSVTILLIALAGHATFAVDRGAAGLPRPLLAAAVAATFEELLFRGVLLRILAGWLGKWWALATSAAIFGAMHAFNPNATVLAVAAIAVEAGILLGAAFLATGRLWLPIGLHAAWNFTETGVFGAAVSGHDAPRAYLHTELAGSTLWTGDTFGPEASLVAVLVCLVVAALFLRKISTQ